MISMRIVAFVFLMAITLFANSQNELGSTAKDDVLRLIADSGAKTVGVAVYDEKTRASLLINEHTVFHAASTMKLPVMMRIFELSDRRSLSLDDRIEVRNSFSSIVDGSAYSLNKDDDGEQTLYARVGQQATIMELVDKMIVRSSNLATNILIEKAGAKESTDLVRRLGGEHMTVKRGVEDGKAFRAGVVNTATAYDLMLLLRVLVERKFLTAQSCDQMIGVLLKQEFNEGIPAGLPVGMRVAHKTGSITEIRHDAAIVFPVQGEPYVIVVLTQGIKDEKKADALISGIARIVHRAIRR
jgi:beta-lactamase class A